jgi:hypothetical protein
MSPHPANARRHQNTRAAMRAALARPVLRLDPAQLKLCLAEHDATARKSAALMAEHGKVFDGIPVEADTRALTSGGRRLDQLLAQIESLDGRAAELRAHPQIKAVILAREAKEERRS